MLILRKDIPVFTDEDWAKACQPLTYRIAVWGDGRRVAYFFDTKGHGLALEKHAIADDGTVTPSVVCPIEGCGFHEWVKLEGWGSKNE